MDIKYFQLFPYDVLEHICSYLNTADIIKLCELFNDFEHLRCSKKLLKRIDLFHEYYISRDNLANFFSVKTKCEFIVSLNLSCIYWIPAADIRKCISSLRNLERLYIVDTKMGLQKPDLVTYNKLSKLKRLAISVTKRTFGKESLKYFPKITHFYLHLDSDADLIIKQLMLLLKKYKCVEEFWLIESATLCYTNLSYITIPRSVTKFNSLLHSIYFSNDEVSQMERIHRNMFTRMEICWEKRDRPAKDLCDMSLKSDWRMFFDLCRTNVPFTPNQTKEIVDRESLDGINFEEINFAHDGTVCGHIYRKVVQNLLLYSSMMELKKLAINFCACISYEEQEQDSDDIPITTKRRKRDTSFLLSHIVENSPYIEELEIWPCLRVHGCTRITNATCGVLSQFKYLRKLTLDNLPIHVNGSFLISVFSSCKHLSSLRLRSKQQNSSLHNMLCLSLKQAVALKDLRYEHHCNINIDKLFLALAENKKIKIERLFIKCNSVEVFCVKPINLFLESSSNLKLFYLAIANLPKVVIRQTLKSLEKYNDDPRKILLITHNELAYSGRIQIPFVHVYEMVLCLTHVSGLDIFNGYID